MGHPVRPARFRDLRHDVRLWACGHADVVRRDHGSDPARTRSHVAFATVSTITGTSRLAVSSMVYTIGSGMRRLEMMSSSIHVLAGG